MDDTRTEILQSREEENFLLESNNACHEIFNPIRWCLPPAIKKYWKTVLLATMLFLAGLVFLLVAILIVALPKFRNASSSVVFFMFGLICIIPGGYHVIYIWNSYKEKEGYNMAKIATFKDEN
ncbi:transmembrane protein 134-like isoform X2 [Hydra vulgaris]|uniref:Transmembrane protein 134-like isoform X2 n=1 Tax=Hydra vulgaris TaxID=6087 RepID=A0ABM4CNW6_HYDVU